MASRKERFPEEEVMFMHNKEEYRILSSVQKIGISYSLPATTQAAKSLAETQDCDPLTVVDYGAADGFNSLPLIRACAGVLHGNQSIKWIFNDLPDFETSYKELEVMLRDEPGSCPINLLSAYGSFYKQVVSDETVDLGICLYAVHWLSHRPPKNCNLIPTQPDDKTKAMRAQDWEDFLYYRSMELKPGGRLVIGLVTNECVSDGIRTLVQDLFNTHVITEEEYQSARVFPYSYRAKEELRDPFTAGSKLNGSLKLIRQNSFNIPDRFLQRWINDGGKSNESATKEYAKEMVKFLKSFNDAIWAGLRNTRTQEEHQQILDIFYEKAEHLYEDNPSRVLADSEFTVVEIVKV